MVPARQQIILGTGSLGLNGTREDAFRLLDAYVDMGGEILDTAAVYSDWVPGEARRSEGVIGDWLKRKPRPGVTVATKGAHPPVADVDASRLDPASIIGDAEGSLKRLGVERLDLYYLHRDDQRRPVAEIMGALAKLVETGKVAAVGVSNWSAARVAEARTLGIVPVASNQVLGNILSRRMGPPSDHTLVVLDAATLKDAEANQTSLTLFTSQAGGYLTKRAANAKAGSAMYQTPEAQACAAGVAVVAARLGVDPTNLGVAFLLAMSPRIFPVIGSKTVAQLTSSMAARDIRLDAATFRELAEFSGFAEWR